MALTVDFRAKVRLVAYYLHRRLKIAIIELAYYGAVKPDGCTDDVLSECRRKRVFNATMVLAVAGLEVIVDGAFHRKQSRLGFVHGHCLRSPNDIIAVCSFSKNPDPKF